MKGVLLATSGTMCVKYAKSLGLPCHTHPVTSSKAMKSGSHSSSEYSSVIWLLFSALPLPLTLADDSVSAEVAALVAATAADEAAAGVMAAGASTRSNAGSEPDAVARLSSRGASAGFEIGRSSRDRLLAPSMLGEDASSRHVSSTERNDLGSMLAAICALILIGVVWDKCARNNNKIILLWRWQASALRFDAFAQKKKKQ
uniref:Uncharacterized protein n=1 Tax=Anopheles atroparvus TaxID=41427 RepID=A0A182J6K0_ANOAO